MILELGNGGDLFERIKERGKHSELEARHIFEQLVKAIDYCHGCRVAHRDLKPENIVFCVDPVSGVETVKVTDFGLSNQSEAEETMMDTYCGSMLYSSPEVLLTEPYVGPMADIWSLGVILYVLLGSMAIWCHIVYTFGFDGHLVPSCIYFWVRWPLGVILYILWG